MRFGQTLFGGSSAAGLVIAAGVALCSANAVGKQEVVRYVGGDASAVATVTSAPRRTATAQPSAALAKATVSGKASGRYSKSGLAKAIASAYSLGPHTDANGAGTATACADVIGLPIRQVRSYPHRADATATARAEGFTYQLGVAAPALAYATALGTTYNIANGIAVGKATLYAVAKQETGARGVAIGTAYGQARVLYTLGARGNGQAKATLMGDAAVTKAGVRFFVGQGIATAKAEAVIVTVAVYQSQTGRASATLEGRAVHTIGGAGHAIATASGVADGLLSNTGVTGVPATCTATMTGCARVDFGAFGNGNAKATGSIGVEPVIINTKVYGAVAVASAYMQDHSIRTTVAKGSATAKATIAAHAVKIQNTSSKAKAIASMTVGTVQLGVRGTEAIGQAIAESTPLKLNYASGTAIATATAEGFNQINDLLKAPDDRTLVVEITSRLLEVDVKDYLLTV